MSISNGVFGPGTSGPAADTAPVGAGGCAVPANTVVPVMWQVRGIVEHGDQRGRLLGYPTANLTVPGLEAGDGVWAGTIQIDSDSEGPTYLAAISIGRRPTYYANGKRLLEANLLGFSGDLYGHSILATLQAYIRPQRRFPGTAELAVQLENDVACVRTWGIGAGLLRQLGDATSVDRPLSNVMMTGRPFAISHKRSKKRGADDLDQTKRERAAKRLILIRRAVMELADAGQLTHEAVAKQTGIPIGYLLWAYPTSDSLLAVASLEPHLKSHAR